MKLKICYFLFLTFVFTAVSQNVKEYTLNNGFDVFNANNLVFDDLGFLWIAGNNLNANNQLLNYKPIIQRYDGNNFYTLNMPEFNGEIDVEVNLTKASDGNLFARYKSKNKVWLYHVNTNSLTFTKIDLPNKATYQDLFLFAFKDYFLAYLRKGKHTTLHKLNIKTFIFEKKEFKPITKLSDNDIPYYNHLIPFKDFFIVNDSRNGVHIYEESGLHKEFITPKTIGVKTPQNLKLLTISTWFKKDNKTYVVFNGIDDYFLYNDEKNTWQKASPFDAVNSLKEFYLENSNIIMSDVLGNFYHQKSTINAKQIDFYLKNSIKRNSISIPTIGTIKTASRDISKELFVVFNGIFRHYSFQDDNILTFLKDKSIRGILEINPNKLLIATEYQGFYIIDLNSKQEITFPLTLNGNYYLAGGNRNLFQDANYYWANDANGIIKIDKKNHKVTSFIYYPVATMTADEKNIYYGTNILNLMMFDKKENKNIKLASTKNFDTQGILKKENVIFQTTTNGLLRYENNQLQHYLIDEENADNYLIAIQNHSKLGVLLGSRTGKLYQFNDANKSFKLLYQDPLNASIATILIDDNYAIWLNTFNGIICFDATTKKTIRYTTTDGLSYFEANRYSALKLSNGNFAVGTLKGLNYFNPYQLSKKNINAKLTFTSINFVDKKTNKQVSYNTPETLASIKSLKLSAYHKSLFIKFGILGVFNINKLKFRYKINNANWEQLNNDFEIKLYNLAAGNYKLQIQAINSAQKQIGNTLELGIFIDNFYYKKPWFYGILLLLTILITYWYYNEALKKANLKTKFANQIIEFQEKERSRIAKELHDNVGQNLLLLKNIFSNDENATTVLKKTINDVRQMSHNMHPFEFEKIGLENSIRNLFNEMQKNSTIFYSYKIKEQIKNLPINKALFIFRMLQECIVNVEKHSKATACVLKIYKDKNNLVFKIKDNGIGFDIEKTKNNLGLKSLEERALYINATIKIKSKINKGTTLFIKV